MKPTLGPAQQLLMTNPVDRYCSHCGNQLDRVVDCGTAMDCCHDCGSALIPLSTKQAALDACDAFLADPSPEAFQETMKLVLEIVTSRDIGDLIESFPNSATRYAEGTALPLKKAQVGDIKLIRAHLQEIE